MRNYRSCLFSGGCLSTPRKRTWNTRLLQPLGVASTTTARARGEGSRKSTPTALFAKRDRLCHNDMEGERSILNHHKYIRDTCRGSTKDGRHDKEPYVRSIKKNGLGAESYLREERNSGEVESRTVRVGAEPPHLDSEEKLPVHADS